MLKQHFYGFPHSQKLFFYTHTISNIPPHPTIGKTLFFDVRWEFEVGSWEKLQKKKTVMKLFRKSASQPKKAPSFLEADPSD
ncbi:hypothetical protein J2X31_000119 [Flavobacterium arsenatis]|uniref:Uncharacterized protein n=1 Tax=Flavobacterium arsenatis TaxID=1484332 RepID=A0ABU1TJL7_9FLAO|nr:hypothetical protein [Flavobacterium arsenatis]